MGYSVGVLNTIRANASEEYQNRIPEATRTNIAEIGNAFSQYEPLYNEFCTALIHKIGKTIIEKKLFKNKLARFKSGSIINQQDVEEIFMGEPKAESSYDPAGPNPLGRRDAPQDKVVYHRLNRADVYAISLGDLDFLRVFRSEESLDAYITGKISKVYSAAEKDEWTLMKNLLGSYDGYFVYETEQLGIPIPMALTPLINEGEMSGEAFQSILGFESLTKYAAKNFVKTVRKAISDLTTGYSSQYNKAGVETWSDPEDLVLFLHKDIAAEVDTELLAQAFNMGKTDIPVPQIVVLDDFGPMADCYGILVDKNWFRVWDTLSRMATQRNEHGLFTNYFYHVQQILSCSPFQNAVMFKPAGIDV